MFQDISPQVFDNHYDQRRAPIGTDYVVLYHNREAILHDGTLPRYQEVAAKWQLPETAYTYLFSVDQTAFYLVAEQVAEDAAYQYVETRRFTQLTPNWVAFAAATAAHLGWWYETNQFCGRCGHRMEQDGKERALRCPHCGQLIFPKISPAIIVGVTDGDSILMTKFLTGYNRYSLISGYAEIGETLEATIAREVHEEVGLSVHNICYYGSQPWAPSESLLVGFFADLNQEKSIRLEHDELAKAQWFKRDEIPHDDTTLSLTWKMIEAFRNHEV